MSKSEIEPNDLMSFPCDTENSQNELSLYGFNFKSLNKIEKPKSITLKMIMDKNLKGKFENEGTEKGASRVDMKAEAVMKLTHVYLDREGIGEIDNLAEYLGDVTHIYLQQNVIKKIENLEFFKKLKFLVLSNNEIRIIENVKYLDNLKLLDLSFNLIDDFDVKELPRSLSFLDLRGNDCITNKSWESLSYINQLRDHLPRLCQLNGEDFVEESDTSTSEEFVEEIDGKMEKLRDEIVDRSKQRRKNDEINLNKISQQRKIKLDEIRQSMSDNLDIKLQASNTKPKKLF